VQKQRSFNNGVKTDKAADAFTKVLNGAGASLHRDAVDTRIIGYLESLGKEGVIYKSEADAGGQAALPAAKAQPDKGGNGIPDAWEAAHPIAKGEFGANKLNKDGYTRLEVYLNDLVKGD